MKVILIGKTGQLGRELDNLLRKKGFKTFSFSHKELDILDQDKIRGVIKKIKPKYVVNASAYHQVAECEEFPEKAFNINAAYLKNLAGQCESVGSVLVHYSTDYVFDGTKNAPYFEEDIPTPLQVYGISKYAGEQIALKYCSSTIIVRTCGVFGGKTGSRAKKGNFILTILNQIKDKNSIEVSSEQIVSPTYARDLASATLMLLSKKPKSGIYHLINEGHCSWADFAQEITRLVGSKTKIIPVDRSGQSGGARRPLFSALKNTRAAKLGVILPSWQDALKRYLSALS